MQDLLGLADPRRPLDAHDGRLAEIGNDAVLALERRLDDLLLDLAVQRDPDLRAMVVLPNIDQRVLLSKLPEGRSKRTRLLGQPREDDRFERRTRKASDRLLPRRWVTERIADADRTETTDHRHLSGHDRIASGGMCRGEDPDRGRFRLLAPTDPDPLARAQGAREQARVGDALTRWRALDLEHAA